MSYYGYYPYSKPKKVKGGIKAHSTRGGFGKTWWAKRWISVLESFDIGERLNRGKSYARRGQVASVDIAKGLVSALVQGSGSWPYKVEIRVRKLDSKEWKRIAETLFARPAIAARLLAGQMPEEIEGAFKDAGLSLFPETIEDLRTDCSCPDWSNPCKHIAAVYLLLAEEFDRDPFLIFRLRGAEREEVLETVGLGSRNSAPIQDEHGKPEPLPTKPEEFWGRANTEQYDPGTLEIPEISAALPKRLGNFPFWRSEEGFVHAMEQIYEKASSAGLESFLGVEDKPD